MSKSDTASRQPSNSSAAPADSSSMPTPEPSDLPLDPRTESWISRLVEGMRRMATNEVERRSVAKRLF